MKLQEVAILYEARATKRATDTYTPTHRCPAIEDGIACNLLI
jgi:hypothetical protein